MNPERVGPYIFGIDITTKTPLHHLSFILQHVLPTEVIANESFAKWHETKLAEENFKERSESKLKEVTQTDKETYTRKNILMSGSLAERLGVPDYIEKGKLVTRDRDCMHCSENMIQLLTRDKSGNIQVLHKASIVKPEALGDKDLHFARLRLTDEFRKFWSNIGQPLTDDNIYLSSRHVVDDAMESYSNAYKDQNWEMRIAGPSVNVTMADKKHAALFNLADRDEVESIELPEWPVVAEEWMSRPRPSGWPSEELRKQITRSGAHMVGVGRKNSSMSDMEWRYSFSRAEKMLALSLNNQIRKLYVILKMIHTHRLKELDIWPTYFLKTLLFWTCENIPGSYFQESDMAEAVLYFLLHIEMLLIKGEVRHYFIPTVNLMADVPLAQRRNLAKIVNSIRKNIVAEVLEITCYMNFINMQGRKSLVKLLPGIRTVENDTICDKEAYLSHLKLSFESLFREHIRVFSAIILHCYPESLRAYMSSSHTSFQSQMPDDKIQGLALQYMNACNTSSRIIRRLLIDEFAFQNRGCSFDSFVLAKFAKLKDTKLNGKLDVCNNMKTIAAMLRHVFVCHLIFSSTGNPLEYFQENIEEMVLKVVDAEEQKYLREIVKQIKSLPGIDITDLDEFALLRKLAIVKQYV